ncbi:MAG: hypothetical protein AB7J35_15330 [Dehalococcoidia bacterium]
MVSIADKEFEADDPYEFVGVRYPAEPGTDPDEIMARCFIEEYALMGMPRDRIMRMFRSAHFKGTNAILQRRGENFVDEIANSVYGTPAREERHA